MVDLARARAPFREGLYESHYLTATDPAGGRALWLRHTALHGKPSVWVTWFDPEPHQERVELDEPLSTTPWPSCSLATMTGTSARGELGTGWDLTWEAEAPPLPYLPAAFLYDRPVPRSNGAAVVPHALVHGSYGDTTLEGWHGVVGHNWGREHAERWLWFHAVIPDGWVDLVVVRVRVGALLTPWTAGGGAFVGGRLRRTRPGRVLLEEQGDAVHAQIPLRSGHLTVEARGGHWAEWDYASPRGRGRQVRNCSVADATMTLEDGRAWSVSGTAAVEVGRPA